MPENMQPTWQHEDCPSWCVVEHAENDLPGDRIHDSSGAELIVMVQDDESVTGTKAEQLFFAYFRQVGNDDAWVHVGSVDSDLVRLTLSPESARALGRMLVAKVADPSLDQDIAPS